MKRLLKLLARRFLRDEGTAAVEFVLCVPFLMFVFMASFESGLAMVRSVMLDRATDIVMRELRLGHYVDPTNQMLKNQICSRTVLIDNCVAQMKIALVPIDRTTWAMPSDDISCIDRSSGQIDPVTTLNAGQQNTIMLVRVCVIQDAIFPFTGVGLAMKVDDTGYRVTAVSSFVNEPS